ncbi:enoyl-CoA hydratase/isomerase family protein [Phenylobacterium sp.]|uniref:enoyl-CoA hydratase/isomerase family protein n=1 Tax=Phenylobacterium sp. TaxID=1871053 RepID=UPI0035B19737
MKSAYGENITATSDGQVAVVTIDRPPTNFVSVELIEHLAEALEAADASDRARCIVLQAEGKAFCAGADLARSDDRVAIGMDGVSALYQQAARLFAVETPIVAAVQGAAVGAGLGLAVACDFRIAAPEARFAANFVKLGFHPGFALTHTLPRLIGEQKAHLMFLTGRRIRAEEALAWGLVDEVVPAEALRGAAMTLAREIAENAPLAVVATRKTSRAGLLEAARAQMALEHREQTILRATDDFAEGVRAVNERRAGNFVGR